MILVDTSVWIEHLRAGSERLKALLLDEQVLCHPFVVGELACGTLQKRTEILSMLKALPEPHLLEHEEVLNFLESRRLYGSGIGWVDAHLLASTLLTGCALWTLDKPEIISGDNSPLDPIPGQRPRVSLQENINGY